MDAAWAAAMSDPESNPNFRRRWSERGVDGPAAPSRPDNTVIGTLGLALQEAMGRRRRAMLAQGSAIVSRDLPP